MTIDVTPVLRLVPNGLRNGRLYMTLIASPVMARPDSQIKIRLDQWPDQAFAAIFGEGKHLAINIRDTAGQRQVTAKPLFKKPNVEWLPGRVAKAWKNIIPDVELPPDQNSEPIDLWKELLESIVRSLGSSNFVDGLPKDGDKPKAADAGRHLDDDGAYNQPSPEAAATLRLNAVLPVKHGDLALLLEFERAARVFKLLNEGASAVTPSCPAPALVPPEAGDSADASTPLDEATLRELLRAEKLKELQDAVDATQVERQKPASQKCEALTKPPLDGDESRRTAAAASHLAGSWAQAAPQEEDPNKPHDVNELYPAERDAVLQVTQAYQAIVSSPAWSRIFGFAFDIYMDWPGDVPLLAISGGEWQLPGDKAGDRRTAWTFVDADGWPAAKTGATVLQNGLFRMGTDCSGDALPRFDAVTIDVRQAAEAVSKPLLEGSTRGFRTAGFTLVDRHRADDVRRQVSRTGNERQKFEVELYADDLLIGRRLDVGMLKNGAIAWRALGSRAVQYGFRELQKETNDDFGAISNDIIADLLGAPDGSGGAGKSGVRTIEQAIVNSASRLAPSHKADSLANDREVFVEEAFATWDGAPMGVHSGPESLEARVEQAIGPKFPFLQKQRLPTKGYAVADLAPPLRDGQSYRFGMRAVFLGGRSKTLSEAAALYNEDKQEYTYPRDPAKDDTRWPLRRFVRQEAIGAPAVLLPAAMLDRKPDEMDFETAQSAILRSLPPGYSEPDGLPSTIRGRRYVRAQERLTGNDLVRIFVPPTAALDDLLRAGIFDDPPRHQAVLRGGLLNMAYGVPTPRNPLDDEPQPEGGFPIGMIEEKRAFGAEPTRRSLALGWARPPAAKDAAAVRGASLFITPDAQNARVKAKVGAKAKKFTPRPYYPDPYATRLILRLRRRSDGSYVGPACEVPVYDVKPLYPDAMPTLLVIRKAVGKVGKQESARWSKPKPVYYDGVNLKSKQGQRMQRVDLTLAQGDDLDLEAFYLPDRKALATRFALVEIIGAYDLAMKSKADDQPSDVDEKPSQHVTTGFYPVPDDTALSDLAGKLEGHLIGTVASEKPGVVPGNGVDAFKLGPPIDDLSAMTVLRVAHVINRPAVAPSFPSIGPDGKQNPELLIERASMIATDRGPPCIELKTLSEQLADLKSKVDTKDYLLRGRIDFDRATTSALEIIAACVSPRDPLFDDPSRRRPLKARVAGTWPRKTQKIGSADPERVPADVVDIYGFEAIDSKTGAVTLKRSEVILLRIDNIAGPGAGSLIPTTTSGNGSATEATVPTGRTEIELALAHLAAQLGRSAERPDQQGVLFSASQIHTFPDGKARRLELRLHGISRFAVDFETAPRWSGSGESAIPVVRLRQPLDVAEQRSESAPPTDDVRSAAVLGIAKDAVREVWLPASRRPDKCAPMAPVPVFRLIAGTLGSQATVTRVAGVRIYLERGWYSSGEGEMLGIVLPAGTVGKDQSSFSTDDEFGPIGPYISRWGGDPIREDYAPLTSRLKPENFGWSSTSRTTSGPVLVSDIQIPVQIPAPPEAEEPLTVLLKADLLTYTPRFDVDREQWFVDLDLCAPETPNLFVRLGLVRFQQHAMRDDLQVSEPVVVWTQLLPERTLSADVSDRDGALGVEVSVRGNVHKDVRIPKAPEGIDPSKVAKLSQPAVNFRLVHEAAEGGVLRRIMLGSATVFPRRVTDADSRWEFGFELAKKDVQALGRGTIYVYAEEVESFMPATYPTEPAYVETIFDADTLVEAGPRFAARLEVSKIAP